MTDRELLQLAAKAAGWTDQLDFSGDCPKWRVSNRGGIYWNPLGEDGDAFRLLVALRMEIAKGVDSFGQERWWVRYPTGGGQFRCIWQDIGNDPAKPARLAITRAAAEIGRRTES